MSGVIRKTLPVLILVALLMTLMGAAVPAQAFSTSPMVAAGAYHTVGLKSDGRVVAVGDNSENQCRVDTWSDITQVAAGTFHTVGLKAGKVVTVGSNVYGQRNVSNWLGIIQVAAGSWHTVGLRWDGTVRATGYNVDGACDVGDWTDIVQVAAGNNHTVGLKQDGTVVAVGNNAKSSSGGGSGGEGEDEDFSALSTPGSNNTGPCDVSDWNNIVQVAAGSNHTLGIKDDGSVVAVGWNDQGQCEVGDWTQILQVSAGQYHTVGLKTGGTVVAVGANFAGECEVGDWSNIFHVAAGQWHTVGLKSDGSLIAVGDNWDGQCNVDGWSEIIQVAAGDEHTVGVRADGRAMAVGSNDDGQCGVGAWKDILQVSAGLYHTVGLKRDGTVVAVGENGDGQRNVGDWKDIIQVAAGGYHTVGLKSSGTVVAVGDNWDGQCNVDGWSEIIQVAAGKEHTVGLKSDGTVVAVGDNWAGQRNVSSWNDIVQVAAGKYHSIGLKRDGTVVAVGENEDGQRNVGEWTDIIQVSAGGKHTVGLKSDGTVVAVGDDWYGQCEVDGWTNIIQVAAGGYHTVGLKSDRTLVGAGDNREFQLKFEHLFLGAVNGNYPGTNLLLSLQGPAAQSRGGQLTYRLFYSNTGSDPAQNVQLTCTLPNGVTVESYSGGGQQSGRIITWTLDSLSSMAGGSKSVTVTINNDVAAGTFLTCNALITTSSPETWLTDNESEASTQVLDYSLPEGVDVAGINTVINETPSVYFGAPTTFKYTSCPTATAVDIRIAIDDGGPDITGSMSGGPPQWNYSITFEPRHGKATVTYTVQGCTVTQIDFSLYIDPAGIIYDIVTGERIAGAIVTLQRPDGLGGWADVPVNLFPIMLPNVNPLITGASGWYQWDTLAGSYRVRVQAEGYYPAYSYMVTVPPPVFDLHVGLTPLPVGAGLWYLDSSLELQKRGQQYDYVTLLSGEEVIWLSTETAVGDVTFVNGIWKVYMLTKDWNGECLIQIGEWNGLDFIPFHAVPVQGILTNNVIEARIAAGGTVLDGNHLALKIIRQNGSPEEAAIFTNGESYLISPEDNPGNPIPELAAGILLGLGLAGLGAFLVLKRRKTARLTV
ncbi:MAG TPA: hypothetical protein VLH15_03080 [Dehalococcoidales bacterium]|nr:hypothetical protein [Dehalococcoidales bacterium]